MRIFFLMIIILFLSGITGIVNAQTGISININPGSQPVWGPTGYDYVENYYFPDMEVYYNVSTRRYYYSEKGRWIYSRKMPLRYRSYDIYTTYKVVINDRDPWKKHVIYRDKYSSYKGRGGQEVIRDSRETKYYANKNHPEHNNWVREQKSNNSHNRSINNEKNDKGGNKANKHNKKLKK